MSTSPAGGHSFSYTAAQGDGTYSFYTLSTDLAEHQRLQTTALGDRFHMHLSHLASASCVAIPGGMEFSGSGTAKVNRENGYAVSFAFAIAGGHTFYTLTVEKGGAVVFALFSQQLRRDGTEHIS